MNIPAVKKIALSLIAAVVAGCAGRSEILPNSDPALNRKPPELAADAAKRFPYKAESPRGGQALARAQIGYVLDEVELINLSDVEWTDVEVWVNGTHVVYLPKMEPKMIKKINFRMFYNDHGEHFTIRNSKEDNLVRKLELYRDGKLYDVSIQAAD